MANTILSDRPTTVKFSRSCKPQKRLTPELQDLVSQAWIYVQPLMVRAQAKHPKKADSIIAAFGIRLCRLASTFNPDKSNLRTWAKNNFGYAMADVISRFEFNDVSAIHRRSKRGWPKSLSLDSCSNPINASMGYREIEHSQCITDHRQSRERENRVVSETLEHLIQPLPATHRDIIRRRLDGYTMREIGDDLGFSESRVSQILTSYRPILEERLASLSA